VKTAAVLALAAVLLPAGAAAAVPVTVDPVRAAVGETVTVSGPAGAVTLESLEGAAAPVALGRLGPDGTITVRIPDVPRGSYRIVVAGSSEAPVLEVVALGQETSIALVAFGLLFILAVLVAGVVIHRRWRDAIS
jgi:nitrous oxidase accessory protein NosD